MPFPASEHNLLPQLHTKRSGKPKARTTCPGGCSAEAARIGTLPDAFEFAGRALGSPLPGGSLPNLAFTLCRLYAQYKGKACRPAYRRPVAPLTERHRTGAQPEIIY